MTTNDTLFSKAKAHIPGGVNSPVRAFKGVGGTPIFFTRAKGSKMVDVDGREYIDYVGSWGPMILGHARDEIIDAVKNAADDGLSFGAPTPFETDVADTICRLLPSMDMVRMTSSGTEATMSAIRLARGYTGRDKVVKFEGCYHGHSDSLLVKAGSGMLTLGVPTSAGVPADFAKHTITLPYNDSEALTSCFEAYGNEIACVIIEPIAGNMNMVIPSKDYMLELRKLCSEVGSVLIYDEVMTGFRVGLHGAQGYFGIEPDMTCLGKIIGAGLPVGAFGGKREIMQHIAPLGAVYQAGTLSGNPLAMRAGLAMFKLLEEEGFYDALSAKLDYLLSGLEKCAQTHGISLKTQHLGGMFGIYFTRGEIASYDDITTCDGEQFKQFFHGMLKRGVYLAPSSFEAGFISSQHSQADLDATLAAADAVFKQMSQ